MDRPEDYVKHDEPKTAITILEEFEDEISQMKGKCIDLGCGPGATGRRLILPRLPPDVILVGVDISQKMIDYAQKTNADEKRLIFKTMNIETTDLPKEDIESYDNAVSFFCLHWIQNLECCYKNIFKMLRPGGNVIIHTLVSALPYLAYLRLAEHPSYKPYMKDVSKIISPLHFDENPRKTVKKIVQEIGFQVLHCSLRERVRIFQNEEEMMTLLLGINPFVDRMPENMKEDYMKEIIKEVKKQSTIYDNETKNGSDEQKLFTSSPFMVLHLKKPKV